MANVKKHRKSKILRIKMGYNPNSSSVGSQIPYLFGFFAGTGILSIVTLHVLNRFKKIVKVESDKAHREEPDEK